MEYFFLRKLQVEVDRFGSGEELPAQCGTEKYDIVFTDYQNLVFESFQYHPVWFVRKSNLDNDSEKAIRTLREFLDTGGGCGSEYTFHGNAGIGYRVFLCDSDPGPGEINL